MALDFLSPLHKASRQIALYLGTYTRGEGVSLQEGHLLSYLKTYAPAPIAELVRIFGIKQSTFTSMLDRLEGRGLLRREVNPEDRRSFLIHATRAGRAVAGRIDRRIAKLEASIRERLDGEDLEGFRSVMRAVADATEVELRRR